MEKELEEKIKKSWQGINPGSYLDAGEKRRKALVVLRDRIFSLVWWYNQCSNDDHPARQEGNRLEMEQIAEELVRRFQDYDTLMYDYQKDWDLNYEDYGLSEERKLAPIQVSSYHIGGFSYAAIPWEIHEKVYEGYSKKYGTSQDIEKIARRGGFGVDEIIEFYPEWNGIILVADQFYDNIEDWKELKITG